MKQNIMKYLYAIGAILLFTVGLSGQEAGQYGQYTVSPILINPALAGASGDHQLLLNYRRQWSGFPGTPTMVNFIYNGEIVENSGIGIGIFNERIAAINRFRATGMYAFHIKADDWKISIGLSGDYVQHRLSNDVAVDPSLDPNDPLVLAAAEGISYFDANFGAYARFKDGFFIGVSVPHLVRARLTQVEDLPETPTTALQSFTIHTGTKFKFEDQGLSLEPSIMVRRMFNGPLTADLNAICSILDDQLYAGLTYRYTVDTGSGLGVLLGARINRFSVFYQYDAGFGTFQTYNSGAHEIGIMYTFGKKM
jgi:type IX secretion system PorP/SprF family membrane protein